MAKQYGTIITTAGAARIAESILGGTTLVISSAAVGDGGGAYYAPTVGQTALVRERWRGEIASAQLNDEAANMLDVKVVLPDDVGGFTVREMGLFAEDGTLVAVCNTPDVEKVTASGSVTGKLVMLMHIVVADASAVEFSVTPTLDTVGREEFETVKTSSGVNTVEIAALKVRADAGEEKLGWVEKRVGEHGSSLQDMAARLETVEGSIGSGLSTYYIRFEPEDWDSGRVVVPVEEHGLSTQRSILLKTIHMLVDRSAEDFRTDTLEAGRERFVEALAAAIAANNAAAGTYPVDEDGNIQLTWEQVQCYLLEQTLVADTEAAAKAEELGFAWLETDTTGVELTTTLDELLEAGYSAALGGSTTKLERLWTVEALRGLRLRWGVEGATGVSKKWDCVGRMTGNAWGVLETEVYLDEDTHDLVVAAEEPYAGEVLVLAG